MSDAPKRMPQRARVKIHHDENTRSKIQAAHIIRRFSQCLDGEIELTRTQVTCGKTLLDKILPDLQAVSLDGTMQHGATDALIELLEAINGKTRTK